MRHGLRPAPTLALAAQALAFWTVRVLLGPGGVGSGSWLALHALLAFGLVLLHALPAVATRWTARNWLAVVFYALYFAALFAGANFALDALHGAERPQAEVAPLLGGLELWQVLCPGVFSLAVGAMAGCLPRRCNV